MNFHVGQRVACVWTPKKLGGHGWEKAPEVGKVYTIRNLDDLGDGFGVRLVEIVNKPGNYQQGWLEANFCPSRFRALEEIETELPVAVAEHV